jgi:hypothetical protein
MRQQSSVKPSEILNMINVCLDTALLSIPNFALNSDEAEQEIERVFQFSSAVANHLPIACYISEYCGDVLWSCGCGPDVGTVSDFLDLMSLDDVYSSNDVVRAYQTILDRASILSEIPQGEVLEFSEFASSPIYPVDLAPHDLVNESKRSALNSLSLARTGITLTACAWSGQGIGHSIELSAVIDSVREVPGSLNPIAIGNVEGIIDLISVPSALVSEYGSKLIWNSASEERSLYFAIAAKAMLLVKANGGNMDSSALGSFKIGPRFISSLQDNQALGAGRYGSITHELCAQLVSGLCNRYQRPMGRPNQIIRGTDGARAMRVHLTDAHEGLRLMYWSTDSGIEFANVGPKMELEIESGARGMAVHGDLRGLGF